MSAQANGPIATSGTGTELTWEAVLADSLGALQTVVGAVADGDWEQPTPCENWNVTQVLQHAAGDQLAWAAILTAGPLPTEDPFSPSGHIAGSPQEVAEQAVTAAAAAWRTVNSGVTQVPTPLPHGELPVWTAAVACSLDAAVHAWDIAVATGQQSPLTPELARPLMTAAMTIVEPLRTYGAYAAVLEPVEGDDDVAVLLRFLGRRPDWKV
jgi:uncharacterized protein (TIGR03086 family)